MTRKQYRRLWVAIAAAVSLSWTGAAEATPSTLGQCLFDLSSCQTNLATCSADLTQTQSEQATCDAGLIQAQSDLSACNAELAPLRADLSICSSDVAHLQADLTACTAQLAACEALAFPASGQTTAFTADKSDGIAGAVTVPDDGVVQAGADLSYTDNGDGTITDHRTGLMWEKKSDDGGLHDKHNIYWWSNSAQETIWDWLADVNAEGLTGFAGYHDWRIPNVKELQSIVSYQSAPAILAAFNHDCAPGATVLTASCIFPHAHWSSTTWAEHALSAWTVNFEFGSVFPDAKASTARVRAVRGGSQ